jgi:FkbM family methyltransferase
MLRINTYYENESAKKFCNEFIHSSKPKYIFGRNRWAKSISEQVNVDGFIDDFSSKNEYLNKPIVSIEDIPNDALVVVVVIGKPLIAEKRVCQFQFQSLDYYSFYKYSKLPLQQVVFWDGFIEDFKNNRAKYEWVYELLNDHTSKNQFYNIINFRLSYDINYMRGFSAIEDKQYFESFLNLETPQESFVDIGAFDGYTSEEFIKKSPQYKSVHLFEPEANNLAIAQKRLSSYANVSFYPLGTSNKKETLRFSADGSSSKVCEEGEVLVNVDRLDNIIKEPITFIKMDIEGAERNTILGSTEVIKKYHPKLAIAAYHKSNDFWKITEQILTIRSDYSIYFRHYTEGVSESVLFFIPQT